MTSAVTPIASAAVARPDDELDETFRRVLHAGHRLVIAEAVGDELGWVAGAAVISRLGAGCSGSGAPDAATSIQRTIEPSL